MLNTMWPGDSLVKVECPGSPIHLVSEEEFHRLSPPDSRTYYYPTDQDQCGESATATLVTLAALPPSLSLPPFQSMTPSSPRPYFCSPSEPSLQLHASPDSSARGCLASPPLLCASGRKRSHSGDSCGSATSSQCSRPSKQKRRTKPISQDELLNQRDQGIYLLVQSHVLLRTATTES